MKTKVSFRVFKDGGDVIAIFPEVPGTSDPDTCMSYQHVGQHGACNPFHLLTQTREADLAELVGLYDELEAIGYDLSPIPYWDRERAKEWASARVAELERVEAV
jgi:hypothetical protein